MVQRPDSTTLCSVTASSRLAEITACHVDVSGTLTLTFTGAASTTGNYSFYVQRTNNPGNTIAGSFGTSVTGTLASAAQMDTYTIGASAGDRLLLRMVNTSGAFYPYILVYQSDGSLACSPWNGSQNIDEIQSCAISLTGTVVVEAGNDQAGNVTGTGNYSFYVQRTNNRGNATAGQPLTVR